MVGSYTVMSHLYIIPIVLEIAGRDGWLSSIFLLVVGLITVSIYTGLGRCMPGKSLMEISCILLGNFLGKVIGLLYSVYFLIPPAITLRGLMDFMNISFMPYTPPFVFALIFLLIGTYATFTGLESIARANEMILPLLILTGIMLSVMTFPNKDYQRLFPVLENGTGPVLRGSVPLLALFGEIVVICMLKPTVKYASFWGSNIVTVLIISLLLIGPLTGPVAVFGKEVASRLYYPTFSQLDYIVEFFENLRWASVFMWMLGSFGRVSLYYYVSALGLSQVLGISEYKKLIWPVGITILGLSLFVFPSSFFVRIFIENIYFYIAIVLGVVFPLLLLLIAILKKHLDYYPNV